MIGFHCSHEQFSPRDMLSIVKRAEKAGFRAAMCSDHIAPWSVRQGHSGAAWPWLGAALEATSLPFGSLAIPGGWRYHPVVLAQMVATLAQMYPGRLPWIAAGSGEAMNEHMVGQGWPDKQERHERLLKGVDIMKSLWQGKVLTNDEGPIKTHKARIWSLPEVSPKIYAAALTPETAGWAGEWADGLITVHQKKEDLHHMITAFHKAGGEGKPLILQMHVSWAETDEQAQLNAWDQWRSACLGEKDCADLRTPEDFDRACAAVEAKDMDKEILISADIEKHIEWVKEFQNMGFDEIYIHNAGRNQMAFLEAYEREFFPKIDM